MSSPRPDLISTLATIGLPVYIVFRLVTGGWTFALFLLLVCGVVGAFYFYAFSGDDDSPAKS